MIENHDADFLKQQQEGQADIERVNQLIAHEKAEVQRRYEEGQANIERINRIYTSFQPLAPPAISGNLAWMPQLQPLS